MLSSIRFLQGIQERPCAVADRTGVLSVLKRSFDQDHVDIVEIIVIVVFDETCAVTIKAGDIGVRRHIRDLQGAE